MSISVVGMTGAQDSDWRRRFGYGAALAIAAALHFAVWQLKDELAPRSEPEPKPVHTIEVSLVAAPVPAPSGRAPEPAPPKAEPKPTEPKKVEPTTPPSPRPKPPPKPKPKPPPKPRAEPKPEPAPSLEKPVPVEREAPLSPRTESPPAPETRTPKVDDSTAAKSRPGASDEAPGAKTAKGRTGISRLYAPDPEYPPLALRRGWQGRVVLRVQVLASGRCGQAEVQQSSGHEMLDEAARESVCKNWRFKPSMLDGQAVDGWAVQAIEFKSPD